MTIAIRHWSELFEGDPSEAVLRAHFDPKDYRVSKSSIFPSGTGYLGAQKQGLCFVLQGQCEHKFHEERVFLKAGEFAELPRGEFEFKVCGEQAVQFVNVYKLPQPGTPEWGRAVRGEKFSD